MNRPQAESSAKLFDGLLKTGKAVVEDKSVDPDFSTGDYIVALKFTNAGTGNFHRYSIESPVNDAAEAKRHAATFAKQMKERDQKTRRLQAAQDADD